MEGADSGCPCITTCGNASACECVGVCLGVNMYVGLSVYVLCVCVCVCIRECMYVFLCAYVCGICVWYMCASCLRVFKMAFHSRTYERITAHQCFSYWPYLLGETNPEVN